jgi:hypothetical protein
LAARLGEFGIAMQWKLAIDRDDLFLLAAFAGFVAAVLSIWFF